MRLGDHEDHLGLFLAGILTTDGVIDGALTERTTRIVPDGRTFAYVLHDGEPRLTIQNDIRQIQLAKAALYAGCRLLIDHFGIDRVDPIRLAGAFGAHARPGPRHGARSSFRIATQPMSRRPGTRRVPARGSRCSTTPRVRESKTSSAGSRRR